MIFRRLALAALVFGGFSSFADMGFYHEDQLPAGTPAAVAAAADSVFRLWVPGGAVREKLLDWTVEELTAKMNDADARKDYLASSQLRFCLNLSLKPCLVLDDVTSGSGFLLEAGNRLWTNRHLFLEYADQWAAALHEASPNLSPEEIAKRVEAMPVPLLVFDKNGVKHPIDGTKTFARLLYGPHAGYPGSPGFIETFSTDLAVIALPENIGTPLKQAAHRPEPGARLAMLGFPLRTIDRHSSFGVPDSTGQEKLHFSFGNRVSLMEGLDRLSKLNSVIRDLEAELKKDDVTRMYWDQSMTIGMLDIEHGNSGGPVLNSDGEVVAIATGSMREYRGSDPSLTVALMLNLIPDP